MDAKVIVPFTDKHTGVIQLTGALYAGSEERIAELACGGYVELPDPEAPPADAKPSRDWKLPQLKEYAAGLGLDASKLQSKDKVLDLISEAMDAGEAEEAEEDPEDPEEDSEGTAG